MKDGMTCTAEKTRFSEFISKQRRVMARELTDNETVHCYNGVRIGQRGDFVVIDDEDRVMIVRKDRFNNQYVEAE